MTLFNISPFKWIVNCDRCPKIHEFDYNVRRMKDAKEELDRLGWTIDSDNEHHYCPDCS